MNKSNLEHLALFILATLFYKLGIPAWLYLGAAAILIELDQARRWMIDLRDNCPCDYDTSKKYYPFWKYLFEWFKLKDTQLDLLMDALGIALIYVSFWMIG